MIELERTYLAKKIPEGLQACPFKEILDVYFPKLSDHPKLRLRKQGTKFEITKKQPVHQGDASQQEEQTIVLNHEEFDTLCSLEGKRVRKIRYYYPYKGRTAEVDVFSDLLLGLVLVDFEFETLEEKNAFEMPDFCLAEVTQETFFAGGIVCGKKYDDLEADLKRFHYQKLFL